MKTTTKIIRIENEKKNTMKKIVTANMITTKKKLTVRIEIEIEKTRFRQITDVELLKKIKKVIKKQKQND